MVYLIYFLYVLMRLVQTPTPADGYTATEQLAGADVVVMFCDAAHVLRKD